MKYGVWVHIEDPRPATTMVAAERDGWLLDPSTSKVFVFDTIFSAHALVDSAQIEVRDSIFVTWMLDWTKKFAKLVETRGHMWCWGGIGKPLFRPFYRYLVEVEMDGDFLLANHITWKKRRAYGIQHNFLFTREEAAVLHRGPDIKKPLVFNVPLLEKLRGYDGYSEKYPAKSEYLLRSNVWDDITEILKGKLHEAQKPVKLVEIPIQVHTNPGDYVFDPFGGDWSKYHKLAGVFENRPDENVYWDELRALRDERETALRSKLGDLAEGAVHASEQSNTNLLEEIQTLRAQNASLEERARVAEQRANDAEKRERIVRSSLTAPKVTSGARRP